LASRTTTTDGTANNNDVTKKSIVSMFPNPANEMVTLRINDGMWLPGTMVGAVDMYGRQLFTISPSLNNTDIQINTQSWPTGVYIFNVHLGDGRIFTSKIVIRK
jgi:hypothetical protein